PAPRAVPRVTCGSPRSAPRDRPASRTRGRRRVPGPHPRSAGIPNPRRGRRASRAIAPLLLACVPTLLFCVFHCFFLFSVLFFVSFLSFILSPHLSPAFLLPSFLYV